jgi:D-3-phosphoglycerate dehydrogenase
MKVIFLDTVPYLRKQLEEAGMSCILHDTTSVRDLERIIHKYDGIVIRSRFRLNRSFLSKARNLKFIGRPGAGLENIDLDYCHENNIKCFRSPEGNRDAVAEHAIGMLLSLFNNLKRADEEVRNGIWKRAENRGIELCGQTVGIIGYGYMGARFAKRLQGFDVNVIAYDKYKKGFGNELVKEVSLEELKAECDILSLHIPLTTETNFMVNSSFLKDFKKEIYLINTARGLNVETKALVQALKTGKVKGACLDVLEYESSSFEQLAAKELPIEFEYILKNDRVILSPHIAGWTHESSRKMADYLAQKIIKEFKP